jgi:hypothetical protein
MSEELRKSLDLLRAEVDALEGGADTVKDRINRVIADLEHQLERSEDEDPDQKLLHIIPDLIEQFETEHPGITAVLGNIMTTLSNIGI